MSLDDILTAAQEQIADHQVETAKYYRDKAMCECSVSINHFKESEIMLQRAHNANRPSILLGATLTTNERNDKVIYIAEARGLTVEGNTPENAFLTFDDTWVGKDQDE